MILSAPTIVKILEKVNAPDRYNDPLIAVDRIIMRSILNELQLQQAGMKDIDVKKADFIQKLTSEFVLENVADSLHALANKDWGGLTPAEVLIIAAGKIRESADAKKVETIAA